MPNPGDPQQLNRYAYVGNNPLGYTDPTGHVMMGAQDDERDDWETWSFVSGYSDDLNELQQNYNSEKAALESALLFLGVMAGGSFLIDAAYYHAGAYLTQYAGAEISRRVTNGTMSMTGDVVGTMTSNFIRTAVYGEENVGMFDGLTSGGLVSDFATGAIISVPSFGWSELGGLEKAVWNFTFGVVQDGAQCALDWALNGEAGNVSEMYTQAFLGGFGSVGGDLLGEVAQPLFRRAFSEAGTEVVISLTVDTTKTFLSDRMTEGER